MKDGYIPLPARVVEKTLTDLGLQGASGLAVK
ncbi:hypothetical protein CFBP3846_05497 [Pseudomonas syringae pv. avii]|uniref:Uncharacterized protein n=3 Tax=Pseudomonas TaxID=286 RepID=A0A2K4W1T3_PSESX|nr:hypothetical protein ALP29_200832 [Pseudomonas syringae pv. avii]SOS29858.1 hypothetical protein CFBP3846_05497 [Pseudomonas syringae pv. avii]